MVFYDIYLKDRLTGKYIPVPILINDYVDNNLNTPNKGDASNYVFTRRFFLYDNLGGIENTNSYINGGGPAVYFKISIKNNNFLIGCEVCKIH